MSKVSLEALFKELEDNIKEEQFKKAIEVCDKILGQKGAENDKEVLTCKILSYIHLSQFEKALEVIETSKLNELQYEMAYCHYKLLNYEKSRDLLQQLPSSARVDQLLAQIHYRMGTFNSSIKLYETLLSNNKQNNETKVNLLANYACVSNELNDELLPSASENEASLSFEYYYNLACCYIHRGDLTRATELLDVADKKCHEYLQNQSFSEEEIEDELAVIKVQKGYLLQLKGSPHLAHELYDNILRSKVSDITVTAIASNNMVSVKKDQKLFSAEKKLQNATSPLIDPKLTLAQRNIILFNRCVCLLKMNKVDQCKELISQMDDKDPKKLIMSTALLMKEKRTEDALYALSKSSFLEHQLCYAQILFQENKLEDCLRHLSSLPEPHLHRPAVVAFRSYLYQTLKNIDQSNLLFDLAIHYWTECEDKKSNDMIVKIAIAATDFKMKNKFYDSAAPLFKLLIEKDKGNSKKYTAQLVICLSYFNAGEAEKYSHLLPAIPSILPGGGGDDASFNIDDLENSSFRKLHQNDNNHPSPADNHQNNNNNAADQQKHDMIERKKKNKKKKKKTRLPKNFNPMVLPDPERWLPRKDRSTFKRRKSSKKPQRGAHQGADSSAPIKIEEVKPAAVVVTQKQQPNKKAKKGRRR